MLRLIPRPLHRQFFRLAHRLRTLWWRIARPRLRGCRVIALDERGYVLLIRHSYGSTKWMLPGGGLRRREDPLTAAAREFAEETGCELIDPRLVAVHEEKLHGAVNRVSVVAGEVAGKPQVDGREVIKAAFFPPGKLPSQMPHTLRTRVPRWVTAAKADRPGGGLPIPPSPPPATTG